MSSRARFYAPQLPSPGHEFFLRGEEYHHLRHVLRIKSGEAVAVFDGAGRGAEARVLELRAQEALLRLERDEAIPCESSLSLQLAPALAKGEKLDWVIQKGTELGVDRFQPLVTIRAELRLEGDRADGRVALEACKQSGRTRIPEILPPAGLRELVRGALPPARIVLHPGGLPTGALLQNLDLGSRASLLAAVGPEGGWEREELSLLSEQGFHAW